MPCWENGYGDMLGSIVILRNVIKANFKSFDGGWCMVEVREAYTVGVREDIKKLREEADLELLFQ